MCCISMLVSAALRMIPVFPFLTPPVLPTYHVTYSRKLLYIYIYNYYLVGIGTTS